MNRKDIDALRLNGYAVVDERIALRHGTQPRHFDPNSWRPAESNAERYEQSFLVAIVIDVAHGDAREIVDTIVAAADSPRALVGKRRGGSAVMLFKCPPAKSGGIGHAHDSNTREEYGSRDGSLRFSLSIVSAGASIDVAAYDWAKRSPLEVDRDRLPVYTPDVPALVTEAAKARCVSWFQVERAREDEANAGKYATMKIPTEQEERERAEEELVARYEGQHVSMFDGPFAQDVIRARKVVAARRAAQGETVTQYGPS